MLPEHELRSYLRSLVYLSVPDAWIDFMCPYLLDTQVPVQ